jgi:uncharacterized protein YciI
MDKVRRASLADHLQYLERQKMCGILQMATASHHARDSHGNETILSQVRLMMLSRRRGDRPLARSIPKFVPYRTPQNSCEWYRDFIAIMESSSSHFADAILSQTPPRPTAQFVLSVDSLEEARSFLHDDPFRIAGLYYEVTIVRSKQEAPKSSRGNLEVK